MDKLVIGSRGSKLALIQTKQISELLLEKYPSIHIQTKIIHTKGDNNIELPIDKIGGKAVFTLELEEMLNSYQIDLAVHSLKDLPSNLSDSLMYIGSPEREDVRDVFISNKWNAIDEIPEYGTIATGSIRRKSQLLYQRPDLHIVVLRGNINTRLKKLDESNWDGIIIAAAAMHRLNLHDRIAEYLSPDLYVPSGGQGALGLEIASERDDMNNIISSIVDRTTTLCCIEERRFLSVMEVDCSSPVGCWARVDAQRFLITSYVGSLDGLKIIQKTIQGKIIDAQALTMKLIDLMVLDGAKEKLISR